MILAASVMVQIYLSGGALLGLLVLRRVIVRRDRWDPLNRRFLFCIRVSILLFTGRLAMTLTGVEAFRILVLLAAALIPLAAIVLTEGLLRRHAPGFVKASMGGAAVIFGVLALWYSGSIDPQRLIAQLAVQIAGFCMAGWMIITRDRASLSAGENTTVVRLGLSLLLFIPLAAGDFLLIYTGLPIQFSALGVLILCWLAIGLARAQLGHGATLASLGVMIAASAVFSAMISFLAGLDRNGALLCAAAFMTTLFVVAILNDARSLRAEEQSLGLLRHLATAEVKDPMRFLRDLQTHPRVDGAVIVSEDSLSELQDPVLDQIFAASPVLRRFDPPQLGPVAEDHIAYLFERYSATHVILARSRPRVLVALAMPSLSASPATELELQVVQRMAALIAAKEETQDG
ncbi:hypothetical protein [Yoonia sp. BS5-3]|uniref:Uncharacterized protein n=1 Tax=Yoonia phaeophyticola TaxID=3137369 RepID=A0ABZ2V0E5_9RHOB